MDAGVAAAPLQKKVQCVTRLRWVACFILSFLLSIVKKATPPPPSCKLKDGHPAFCAILSSQRPLFPSRPASTWPSFVSIYLYFSTIPLQNISCKSHRSVVFQAQPRPQLCVNACIRVLCEMCMLYVYKWGVMFGRTYTNDPRPLTKAHT